MPEKAQQIIDVDLGDNGGQRVFRTIDELDQWFKTENAFWDWLRQANWDVRKSQRSEIFLRQAQIQSGLARLGSDAQLAGVAQVGKAIQAFRLEGGTSEGAVASLVAALREVYAPANQAPPKAIHSGSLAGKAVDLLRQQHPKVGAIALGSFLQQKTDIVSSDEADAICRSVLYEQGLAGTAGAAKAVLEELLSEWTGELAEAKKTSRSNLSELSALVANEVVTVGQRKDEFAKFMLESQAGLSSLVVTSKNELASIEKTYNEKLALQASVSYWTKKAVKHTRLALSFAVASVLAFMAGGWALYETMTLVIGETKVSEVQVWKLGVLAILATVVVWAARVVVRLLMSNLHLHDDAEERKTMLLTYLSLLREGSLPEGDVRQLILQALFRPAATGIIKDDAAPPFMAQWLKLTTGSD